MTAEAPLTSVDFMSDGATLAVGSTRGVLLWIFCTKFTFSLVCWIAFSLLLKLFLTHKSKVHSDPVNNHT